MKFMIFILLSFSLLGMEYNSQRLHDLEKIKDYLDAMKKNLEQQSDEFNKIFNNYGLNNKPKHSNFINIPESLKGKSFFHIKCDCQELIKQGHYCGSHALAHAIDIEQTYALRDNNIDSNDMVIKAFRDLCLDHNPKDLQRVGNIKEVAQHLKLDHIFLNFNQEYHTVEAQFKIPGELPTITAIKKLEAMRSDLYNAYNKAMVKHVFAIFTESDGINHVVVFSIVWDKAELSLITHDNLNNEIKINSIYFKFAEYLIKFFIDTNQNKLIYDNLIKILVFDAEKRSRYLEKLINYQEASAREHLLNYLYESWLGNTIIIINNNALELKPLNNLIKPLKSYYKIDPLIARNLLRQTYDVMIDRVKHHHENDINKKLVFINSIITAIKKTANEEKIFSFTDDDDKALFMKSQDLRNALQLY